MKSFFLTAGFSFSLIIASGFSESCLAESWEDGLFGIAEDSSASEIACGSSMTFTEEPEPLPKNIQHTYSANLPCRQYLRDVYPVTSSVSEICKMLSLSGYGFSTLSEQVSASVRSCNEKLSNKFERANCDSFRPPSCSVNECEKRRGPSRSCSITISKESIVAVGGVLNGTSNSCKITCDFVVTDYQVTPGTETVTCTDCGTKVLAVDAAGVE